MTNARHALIQRLTAREELFVLRVFEGQPLIAAYRAAYSHSGMNERQITAKADAVLSKDHVQFRLKEHRDRAAAAAGIDVALVLNELVAQAFIDPSRLVRTKSYCCRHCHGFEGHYQWKDESEFNFAFSNWRRAHTEWAAKREQKGDEVAGPPPVEPNDLGGYEFKKILEPNPHCENCNGAGAETRQFITDTEKLLPHERRAIAGIKQTKYGVTVELRDRSVPLRMIAEHLGMFVKKVSIQNPDGTNFGSNNEPPEKLAKMESAELLQLKALLSRALGTGDNSAPTDVVPRPAVPDSNNIPMEKE